jgi:hypothetical protein
MKKNSKHLIIDIIAIVAVTCFAIAMFFISQATERFIKQREFLRLEVNKKLETAMVLAEKRDSNTLSLIESALGQSQKAGMDIATKVRQIEIVYLQSIVNWQFEMFKKYYTDNQQRKEELIQEIDKIILSVKTIQEEIAHEYPKEGVSNGTEK